MALKTHRLAGYVLAGICTTGCGDRSIAGPKAALKVENPVVRNGEEVALQWSPGQVLDEIKVDFTRLDSEFTQAKSDVNVEESGGSYRIAYKLSRVNSRPDGVYEVAVTGKASDGFLLRQAAEVTLSNKASGATTIILKPANASALFDHSTTDLATIEVRGGYPLVVRAITVETKWTAQDGSPQALVKKLDLKADAAVSEGAEVPGAGGTYRFLIDETLGATAARSFNVEVSRECSSVMVAGKVELAIPIDGIDLADESGRTVAPVGLPVRMEIDLVPPIAEAWRSKLTLLPSDIVPIAAQDLSGDGRAEIFLFSPSSGSILVFEPKGANQGRIYLEVRVPETIGDAASVGDVDGDGVVDLIATTPAGLEYLLISGDVQDDGQPYRATRHSPERDSDGSEKERDFERSKGRIVIRGAFDVDGDGLRDIARVDIDAGRLQVTRVGPGGTSVALGEYLSDLGAGTVLALGAMDLTGEGASEIVSVSRLGAGVKFALLQNGGKGVFGEVETIQYQSAVWGDLAIDESTGRMFGAVQESNGRLRTFEIVGAGETREAGSIRIGQQGRALALSVRGDEQAILGEEHGQIFVANMVGRTEIGGPWGSDLRVLSADVDGDGNGEFVISGLSVVGLVTKEGGSWKMSYSSGPRTRYGELLVENGGSAIRSMKHAYALDVVGGAVAEVGLGATVGLGGTFTGPMGAQQGVVTRNGLALMGGGRVEILESGSVRESSNTDMTAVAGPFLAQGQEAIALYRVGARRIAVKMIKDGAERTVDLPFPVGWIGPRTSGVVALSEGGEQTAYIDTTQENPVVGPVAETGLTGIRPMQFSAAGGLLSILDDRGSIGVLRISVTKGAVRIEKIRSFGEMRGGLNDAVAGRIPAEADARILVGQQTQLLFAGAGADCGLSIGQRADRVAAVDWDGDGSDEFISLDSSTNEVVGWAVR